MSQPRWSVEPGQQREPQTQLRQRAVTHSWLFHLLLVSFAFRGSLCDALECRQRLCPEAVEIAAQSFEAVRVDRIDTTSSFRAIEDQTRSLQHPQGLGDGGGGRWE